MLRRTRRPKVLRFRRPPQCPTQYSNFDQGTVCTGFDFDAFDWSFSHKHFSLLTSTYLLSVDLRRRHHSNRIILKFHFSVFRSANNTFSTYISQFYAVHSFSLSLFEQGAPRVLMFWVLISSSSIIELFDDITI